MPHNLQHWGSKFLQQALKTEKTTADLLIFYPKPFLFCVTHKNIFIHIMVNCTQFDLKNLDTRAGTIRVSHDTIRITIQLTRYDIYHDTFIRHKDTEKFVKISFLGHGHGLG